MTAPMTTTETKRTNGWRIARWSAAALLLLTPLAMMQITDEWNWGAEDFIAAGIMIGGTLLLFELAVSVSGSVAYKAGAAAGLAGAFLLVWSNLAVGIVGDPDNPTNLGFYCVVLTAGVAAFTAKLRAESMARAMLAVAAMQTLLGLVIGTAPSTARDPAGVIGFLMISTFFTALWLGSAALFRKAARDA